MDAAKWIAHAALGPFEDPPRCSSPALHICFTLASLWDAIARVRGCSRQGRQYRQGPSGGVCRRGFRKLRFAESRPIAEFRASGPATHGETVMRFGIFGLLAALAVGMITVTGDVRTADAQACRKNYYRCDLNRGGRIDPANPNCCWSPAAGPPSASCPRKFYKCDLNAGGRLDPQHPGCCWNLR